MSDQDFFRLIPTKLDLNGPILGFSTNPVGVGTTNGGSVTLSGIATAEFPNAAENNGSISYQWYEVGEGAVSNSDNITGAATTTITLSNLSTPGDNGRQFFLRADYQPAQRTTGNAVNDPLDSDTATITIDPLIEIIAQPTSRQALINTNATFTVDADLTDSSYTTELSYQWQVDGEDVSDGTFQKTFTESTSEVSNVDITYTSDDSITLPSDATNVVITAAGGKGGDGGNDSGGNGGLGYDGRAGRLGYIDGSRTLEFKIGRRGNGGTSGGTSAFGSGGASSYAEGGPGGGAGSQGWSGGGGGGGGATAVYDSVKGGHTIVSAGGGGGGGGSFNRDAGAPPNSAGRGLGFGQVRDAMESGTSSPYQGNTGATAGGDGGGGGGGGGGASPSIRPGAGGGGTGGADNVSAATGGNGGASGFDPNYVTFNFDGYGNDGDGYVNLKYTGTSSRNVSVVRTTTFSGTNSNTLTISSDRVGIQTVSVTISQPDATNSPLTSDAVNFATVSDADQFNVNVEAIGIANTATLTSVNLFNGDYTFSTSGSDAAQSRITNYYSIYAPDKDLTVEMDLYGGKGYDSGAYSGGEGGYSRIRFTMEQNVEYVIAGLSTSVNAPFVYRKATLIAAAGGGGDAGGSGNGGFGGGIGISGEGGRGRGAGVGGEAFDAGTLPADGIFGSRTALIATAPDTKATVPSGGRALKCTRGDYWRDQGFTACEDITTGQARISDGTVVANTASITRGYKDGYSIIQTDGRGDSGGGDGGAGATGGNGGTSNSGGGGGSGYTDGSVTVVDADLGGSTENAKVILRIVT